MISKSDIVKETSESERLRTKLRAALGKEQVKNYDRDSARVRDFYNRFITTFPHTLAAYNYVSMRWRVPLLSRLNQQTDIGIEVAKLMKSAPPLMLWYLQLARYRDSVEQVIDWLRPFVERFDLLDARSAKKSEERLRAWHSEPPPKASYLVNRLRKLSEGLLEGLLKEIRLDARNAISHIDYMIDLEQQRLRFFSPGGVAQEWTYEELATQCSTMWLYLRMLAIEWTLTWGASLMVDVEMWDSE